MRLSNKLYSSVLISILGFSSFCYASEIPQSALTVNSIYDGVQLNNENALTIALCDEENNSDCFSITLNRTSIDTLFDNRAVKNYKRNNQNIVVTADMLGRHYVISSKHETGSVLKIESSVDEKLTLKFLAQLVSIASSKHPKDNYIKFDLSTFNVTGEQLQKLRSFQSDKHEVTSTSNNALSDCEYSKQMLEDISPFLDKAITFVSKNASYQEIAKWRVSTFNPSHSAIRKKFDMPPSAFTTDKNREISRIVYNDFLVRSSLLVQEIYTHARNGGSKDDIKLQWATMKQAANKYAEQCELQNKQVNVTTPAPNKTSLPIKMSKSGLCHTPSSRWYDKTENYTSYDSIESCLANGGKQPRS